LLGGCAPATVHATVQGRVERSSRSHGSHWVQFWDSIFGQFFGSILDSIFGLKFWFNF
jgi:hypothetical protein